MDFKDELLYSYQKYKKYLQGKNLTVERPEGVVEYVAHK